MNEIPNNKWIDLKSAHIEQTSTEEINSSWWGIGVWDIQKAGTCDPTLAVCSKQYRTLMRTPHKAHHEIQENGVAYSDIGYKITE